MKEECTLKSVGETREMVIHTTLTREIRPIRNWYEWLALWQRAETLEEMLGMLHVGFNVRLETLSWEEKREYDEIDRLTFYFTIADGWTDDVLLRLPEDIESTGAYSDGKTPRQLRQRLAHKAFDMLCISFFKEAGVPGQGRLSYTFGYQWESVITSERLFQVIQNFFKEETPRYGEHIEIRNLGSFNDQRTHNERFAVNFLLNLAKFMWTYTWRKSKLLDVGSTEERGRLATTLARINAAKPWMVTVLSKLDEFGVLREWILELDKACLAKLEEIAFRGKLETYHTVKESRHVMTLDEACYAGSKTGWFLKEHELKLREHARLAAILEVQRLKKAVEKLKN